MKGGFKYFEPKRNHQVSEEFIQGLRNRGVSEDFIKALERTREKNG